VIRKLTKGFILTILLIVSLKVALSQTLIQGILLMCVAVLGMVLLEIREAERYIEAILKRIYVCVDFETALALAQALEQQLLFNFLSRAVNKLTIQMTAYYKGDFDHAREIVTSIFLKEIEIWSTLIRLHVKRDNQFLDEIDKAWLETVFKKAKMSFQKRMVEILLLGEETFNKASVIQLRTKENSNLHMAELSYMLAMLTTEPRKKNYLLKAAANLAPETYFNQVNEEA
jgi:hypothetical protein